MTDPIPIVFDIHVWVLAITGENSTFPRIPAIPPTSGNPSADCLSIAFDAEEFAVWASPHTLENTARVLRGLGVGDTVVNDYVEAILDVIDASGGQAVDPSRVAFDSEDFEDNLILDLAIAADALIVVSDDTDLTMLSPWNGRLILRPFQFVEHVVKSRRRH